VSSTAPAPKRAASGPDYADGRDRARWPGLSIDAAFGCGLAALFVLVAFVTTGGTDLAPNTWVEIGAALLAAVAAAAVIVIGGPGRAWGGTTLLLFAALAALTFASIAWSVQPDNSWVEANRTLSYLAAFGTAMALARLVPAGWRAVIGAVAAAAVALSAYALLAKVFPATLDANDPVGRLRAPFDYWNATGLIGALGLAPCIWGGARAARGRLLRALTVPAIAILLAVVVLSYSRGALIAAIVGCGCWFALTPMRLRGVLVLGLGAVGGAVVTVWALAHHALTHDNATLASRTSAGHTLGIVLLVMIVVLAVAGFAATIAMDRIDLRPRARYRVGVGLIAALALVPLGGVVAVATSSRGLPGEVSHIWTTLTSANGVVTETPGRLVELSNSRPRYWREGLRVGEHAVLKGTGAGGFLTARAHYSNDVLVAGHAHSYVIETFADFGLLGILVSLGLLIAWGGATVRTLGRNRRREPRIASAPDAERAGLLTMLAVVLTFGVHSAIDWTWFFPGVAIPALVCAGWLAARGPLSEPVGRLPSPRRLTAAPAAAGAVVAIAAIAIAAAWVIWQPLRSSDADASAITALLAGDSHKALADAHTAVSTDPVSADALWELSEIDLAVGDRAGARSDLVRAASRQPSNPETWERLGEFDLRYGQPRMAVGELTKAGVLDQTALQPLWDLSNAYIAAHDPGDARHALIAAVTRQWGNPEPWQRLGTFDLHHQAAGAALTELQGALARDPASGQIRTLLARAQAAVTALPAPAAAAAKTAAHRRRAH
jgi:tetratricopeptide (TPR) repeat protein